MWKKCLVFATATIALTILSGADKEVVPVIEEVNKVQIVKVSDELDIARLLLELERNPVEEIQIKSSTVKGKELYEMFYRAHDSVKPELLESYKLLNSYSTTAKGYVLTVKEVTDRETGLEEHLTVYKEYVKEIAEKTMSKSESDLERLFLVYDRVYGDLEYTSNDWTRMNAGNFINGETSCTGFSKLVSDVLDYIGIENKIEYTDSHYWNLVTIDGKETIVDIATDKLLKEPYKTFGMSSVEHRNSVSELPYDTVWYKQDYESNKDALTAIISKTIK